MKPWLAQRAAERPDALALSTAGVRYTYGELEAEVSRRAAALADMGVTRGSRVGLCGENSLGWVLNAHALFWRGATLVPVHPRASEAELDRQLGEVDLDMLLTDADLEPAPLGCPPARIEPDDVLTILFTSGTTGAAKAVPLTIGNHQASALASARRLGCAIDDHWLCCLPLCHIGGLAILLRSVIYGTSFELVERFDATEVLALLRDAPITLASFVPTMLHRLLRQVDGPVESSLRAVLVGGGPITADLLDKARQRGIPALPTYGMTEAGSQLATLSPTELQVPHRGHREHREKEKELFSVSSVSAVVKKSLETCGRPLEGVELRVDDDGAIWARGPMLTSGYSNAPDINAERFIDGWFRTGDIGFWDDRGRLVIEHRKSDLIVSGGENVDPGEVEQALLSHDAVADVAVVGLDDDEWGEVVCALVVPRAEDVDPSRLAETLDAWCRDRLAPFKVPRRWTMTVEIPRTHSGKIHRSEARRLAQDSTDRERADVPQ